MSLNEIKYPRRKFIRRILQFLASRLAKAFLNVKIIGLGNLPAKGAFIVAGNHSSPIDPVLLLTFISQQIEFLGSGDIPIDPRMSFLTDLYGFIPINRGQIDQAGLSAALNVLAQDGILGIFPEGGIWEKNLKQPKIGISFLAYKSGADVIPVGISGADQVFQNIGRLKKTDIEISIGKVLRFDDLFDQALSRKENLNNAAILIMEKIKLLVNEDQNTGHKEFIARNLEYILITSENERIRYNFQDQGYFTKLIEQPVIMDAFIRNLKLPVKPLLIRNNPIKRNDFLNAVSSLIRYLRENDGFLSYRFGIDDSLKMIQALERVDADINNMIQTILSVEIRTD